MPAKSEKQKHFFGMVHALQTGKASPEDMPAGIRKKLVKTSKSISKKASGDFAKSVEEYFSFPALTFKEYLVVEAELMEAFDQLTDYELDQVVEACMQDEETSAAAKDVKSAAKRGGKEARVRKSEENEEPAVSKKITKAAAERGGKEARLSEKWKEEYKTPESKKGMWDDWTQAELKAELAKLRKSGPHEKGSADYTKEKEIIFALRSKHGWKEAE